jgi:hypothetical protein
VKRIGLTIAFVLLWAIPQVGFAQSVFGAGYYEQNNANLTYTGTWTQNAGLVGTSAGTHSTSNVVGSSVTWQMQGTTLVLYRTTRTDGTAVATICFDANCQAISFNDLTTTRPMQIASYQVACLSICTVSITHTGGPGSFITMDAMVVFSNPPTITPIATQTSLPIPMPVTFAPNYPTQIPPLTQIPYPTRLPTNTALPVPLPVTFDPGNFPTPLATNTPYLYPTPLPTWTAQSVAIDWSGYPTPLPTWTAQAVAAIEITLQGTFIASVPTFDPAVLGTYLPTREPTPTPTATPTDGASPTPSATITPTPDSRYYWTIDVSGTPQAIGVIYEVSAGEWAIVIIQFVVLLILGSFFLVWLVRRSS